jgi:SPP1 gp7 family putative phage head morphogenesis protein
MARRLISSDKSEAIALRNYAPVKAAPPIPIAALQKIVLANPDASAMNRTRFGRSISADMIEVVLKRAAQGSMRDLTDLIRESIFYDPHYAGVLRKRLGTVAALPWEVRPADGPDVDKELARDYTSIVRAQIMNMVNFRDFLQDLAGGVVDGRAASELDWIPIQPMTVGKSTASMAISRILYIHPRRLNFGSTRYLIVTDESKSNAGSNFNFSGYSLDPVELKKQKLYRKYVQWMPRQFGDYQEMEGAGCRALIWAFFKRFAQRDRMQLLELFGKPWRVGNVAEDSNASPEDLNAAKAAIDGLGGTYSALLPRGVNVDILKPGDTAGNVHKDVIAECDRQISKLILGQTGTTDNMAGGLNTSQATVMQDEQFAILSTDALAMAQVIEDQVTDAIIEVNFGADQLPNAPHFILRSDLPPNRNAELERLDKALKSGLEIEVDEAYEVSGFRRPEENATVIRMDQPPSSPLSPVPPAPRPVIVYPPGDSPAVGEQQPIAEVADVGPGSRPMPAGQAGVSDVASIVTVNEARAGQNLPPLTKPDGTPDPDGDLTIAEYNKRRQPKEKTEPVVEPPKPEEVDEPVVDEEDEDEEDEDEDVVETSSIFMSRRFFELDSEEAVLNLTRAEMERDNALEVLRLERIALVNEHGEPESAFGSPDEIVKRGERELWSASRSWADAYEAAVRGQSTAVGIYNAMVRAAEKLDINGYARPLERRMRQGAALGCLDNSLEVGQIDSNGSERSGWNLSASPDIEVIERLSLAKKVPFSEMPFKDAMAWFRARGVMPRATFEAMSAEVRRKSFTIAGIQSKEMLTVLQAELARQIGQGGDLRVFAKSMEKRLISSGMVASKLPTSGALSASHVENVFRTNMANSYQAGRYTHATQPEVMRARPIWEVRTIRDNRTRPTHLAVNGKMLYASDPLWQRLYPPFGWLCRCRVITRDARYASQVGSASEFVGLPDTGFTSGVSSLL